MTLHICMVFLLTTIHSCESLSIGNKGVYDSKDCPHPCEQGGHKFCNPIPCPLPPCDDPVTTPGECCPHCPNRTEIQDSSTIGNKSCPDRCELNGNYFCYPPPCPPPPCKHPLTLKGFCCQWCLQEDDQVGSVNIASDIKRSSWPLPDPNRCDPPPPCVPIPPGYCNGTVIDTVDYCCPVCSTDCPSRCQMYGNLWCTPSECPPLFCPKMVWTKGDCCPHCEM